MLASSRFQKADRKFYNYPRDKSGGYDMVYFEGLTAEEKVMHVVKTTGRVKPMWMPIYGRRNEPLDLAVYNLAALHIKQGTTWLNNRRKMLEASKNG